MGLVSMNDEFALDSLGAWSLRHVIIGPVYLLWTNVVCPEGHLRPRLEPGQWAPLGRLECSRSFGHLAPPCPFPLSRCGFGDGI